MSRTGSAHQLPRVALCASPQVSDTLAESTEFEFISFGHADPAILSVLGQSDIEAILVHWEPASQDPSQFVSISSKALPALPCFVLCEAQHQNALQLSLSQNEWRVIAVRDMASIQETEERLRQALFLYPWMQSDTLRRLLGALKIIPTENASRQRILTELRNSDFDLDNVSHLIRQDPSLTAQLLKIGNSPVLARTSRVLNLDEVVSNLGATKLQALISAAWAFFAINEGVCPGFNPKREWAHATEVAESVSQLCRAEEIPSDLAETTAIAGLLHDFGKVLLAANAPAEYAKVLEQAEMRNEPLWKVENQMLGFNHAEVAGCLLALWGVPLPVAEAVLLHHAKDVPAKSPAALIQKAHETNGKGLNVEAAVGA
jgi:HD-like signal output (HDOD) protein